MCSSRGSSSDILFFLGFLRLSRRRTAAWCRCAPDFIAIHVVEAQLTIRILIILSQDLIEVPPTCGKHVSAVLAQTTYAISRSSVSKPPTAADVFDIEDSGRGQSQLLRQPDSVDFDRLLL